MNSTDTTVNGIRNIVLVHGAFADGSGWRGVYDLLAARGYRVSVVQNPLTSFDDDVAATRRVLDQQDGPTILVGHSYGGVTITEAGRHENVAGLTYSAGFAPDAAESANTLITDPPPGPPGPPILPHATAADPSPISADAPLLSKVLGGAGT